MVYLTRSTDAHVQGFGVTARPVQYFGWQLHHETRGLAFALESAGVIRVVVNGQPLVVLTLVSDVRVSRALLSAEITCFWRAVLKANFKRKLLYGSVGAHNIKMSVLNLPHYCTSDIWYSAPRRSCKKKKENVIENTLGGEWQNKPHWILRFRARTNSRVSILLELLRGKRVCRVDVASCKTLVHFQILNGTCIKGFGRICGCQ